VGLAVLGVLCLAAAAILKWVALPSQAKVPSNENTTRQFDGNAKVLFNPQALSSGDPRAALAVNTPVNASRTVKTLATSGNVAEMQDTRTLRTANGQNVGSTQATYAVDRKTLEATSDHPSSWHVTAAKGLTVSWPIGTQKKDYTGWVSDTQTTTTLKYLRQETKQGLTTYVYQANTQPAPIKDPQVLATLPKTLPISALQALSSVLPLPADVKAQLTALLPRLPQPVTLAYNYQVNATYWVEPTTGLVIDTQREEVRTAGIVLPGNTVAGAIPVFDVTTAYTSGSVNSAASDAKDKKGTIDLLGSTLPLILLIIGILALLAALILFLLSRRHSGGREVPPTEGHVPPEATAG
jgi:hypothetical protein